MSKRGAGGGAKGGAAAKTKEAEELETVYDSTPADLEAYTV
jgi:hypothetical protein